MKGILSLVLAGLALTPGFGYAAQTAQSKMYCLSLRLQHANEEEGLYSLDFTTLDAGINGELAPDFTFLNSGYTNSAYVILTDEIFDEQYPTGLIGVDLPAGTDVGGNGLPDFFEVAKAVNATTEGAYDIPQFGAGSATAQWFRDAGSSSGACVLTLRQSSFQNLVFTHAFEIFEYTGPLSYTPGATNVSGQVDLAQTGNVANQFHGPVQFTKIFTNKYNLLTLQTSSWTNASAQTFFVWDNLYSRDLTRLTNYSGYLEFQDGNPDTADDDFWLWRLTISDPNDTDHDGIPDFSDDPANALPRRPSLSVFRTPTNLLFSIHGDVGHVHQIQEASALNSSTWPTVASVSLTNDPQSVSLPFPTNSIKFWRAQAQ